MKKHLILTLSLLLCLMTLPAMGIDLEQPPLADGADAVLVSTLNTPDGRMHQWHTSLLEFVQGHPDLEPAALEILENLSKVNETSYFAAVVEPAQQDFFRGHMNELAEILTFNEYSDLMHSLQPLRGWMGGNDLAIIAPGGTCNCDSDADCTSYCASVQCTSGPGSKSWGVCQ